MGLRADRHPDLAAVFFVSGESLVIFSAAILLWTFQDTGTFTFTSISFLNAAIFTLLCQMTLYLCGLYDPALKSGAIVQAIGLIQAYTIAFGLMLLLLILIGRSIDIGAVFLSFIVLLAFSKAWRLLVQRILTADPFRPKIILAGMDRGMRGNGFPANDPLGERKSILPYTIVATANKQGHGCSCSDQAPIPHHTVENWTELAELAKRYKTHRIVIARNLVETLSIDDICTLQHRGLRLCTEDAIIESISGRREPGSIDPAGLIFSKSFQYTIRSGFKRVGDIVIAALLLLLLSPLILLIMGPQKLRKAEKIIEIQTCVGYRKQRFARYRFVFPGGIPASLHQRFILALPQLWNVLKGEMSLVGPQPLTPDQLDDIHIPFMDERFTVRPGLTGWAQINCSCDGLPKSLERMLSFDLFYLKHISMFMDTVILLRTLKRRSDHRTSHPNAGR